MTQGLSINSFEMKTLRSKLISAQKLLKEKKYTEALKISNNLIKAHKSVPLVHMLRGDVMTGLEKYQEAIESYSKCLDIHDLKLPTLIKIAANYRNLGSLNEAIGIYEEAFEISPKNAGILNSIGNAYKEMGQPDKALLQYEKALKIDNYHIGANYNKGVALSQKGEFSKSKMFFRRILKQNEKHFLSLRALGRACFKMKDYKGSLEYFLKALELKREDIALMNEVVEIHNKLGNFQRSKKILEYALKIKPDDHLSLNNLGNVFNHLNDYKLSIKMYNKAIKQDPKNDRYIANMGVVVAQNKSYQRAIPIYEKAIKLNPTNNSAHLYLGIALLHIGYHEKAIQEFEKSIELNGKIAEPYYGLGKAYIELQKNKEAIESFRTALAIDPEHDRSLNGLSFPLIKTYRFDEGWKHYEYRWAVEPAKDWKKPIEKRPMWNGEVNKKVVLWREQGIGDDILFMGLLLEASQITKSLTVYTLKRLLSLCKRGMPGITFKPYKGKVENEDFDYHLPMGSLPKLFRRSEKDFENTVCGYLKADKRRVEALREELGIGNKKVIGISWTSFKGSNMGNKNIKLKELSEVFKGLNILLLNLQYGDVDKEIKDFTNYTGIKILQCQSVDNREDIEGLAALIEMCDLVVSTSNVTIHLAGALGKEAWVLLPYAAHFWWMLDRSDSLWYPTVKLYRQKKFQDWSSLTKELKKDLRERF